MGAWQPTSTIPGLGPDGAARIDWGGPAGAPFDFDLLVPEDWDDDAWLGQIRLTPDSAVLATFSFAFGAPADGEVVVTATVATTALTDGECYVYGISHDAGLGFEPVASGSLSPTLAIPRP